VPAFGRVSSTFYGQADYSLSIGARPNPGAHMNIFSQIDWESVLVPSLNVGEIILRGSVVYLFLFILLRILRRGAGTIGISDLLVIVLIADAAQNAMASEYKSITEGLILVTTIVSWDYFLDCLGYKFPAIRHLLRPAPSLLIKDGRIRRANLRREMITEEELIQQLREQGIQKIQEVKESYIEGDGRISVITEDTKDKKRHRQKTSLS
jgi:uncharacterized membrane protein YcaP (DUF421 family)